MSDRDPRNNSQTKAKRVTKRRRHQPATSAAKDPGIPLPQLLQVLLVGGYTATLVAAALVPTDVIPRWGAGMGLTACWFILLLVWWLSCLVSGQATIRWGPTSWALLAFLTLHSLSGLAMLSAGNPRSTVNMIWLWLGFGAVFWLARQLLRTPAECRAAISVMIALAVGLSMFGYYQYFVSLPRSRADYRKDPEGELRKAGIVAPAGTPQRKHFEDRLNSTEPISTFTLTNSLAGFLAPWLAAAVSISISNWRHRQLRWGLALTALLSALLIGGCWILTKSRTSWVAFALGLAVFGIYGRRSGWQPNWRWLAIGVGLLGLLAVLATVVGGLDWLVLSESSKALVYRLQYWRSTAALISEHAWFGCGPGNFQQFYQAQQLPEASESVATPHNFLLEVWATAGTPAMTAWIGLFGCLVWQLRRGGRSTAVVPTHSETSKGKVRTIYWGSLVGVLIAYPLGAIAGDRFVPAIEILAVGVPPAALMLLAGHRWVLHGDLPLGVLVCALGVLLLNLLGAGGISYAGVAVTLWLLVAVMLNLVESQHAPLRLTRPVFLAVGIGIATVALLFFQTMYFPVLNRKRWINEGQLALRLHGQAKADAAFRAAAEADPHSEEPWIELASLRHSRWQTSGGAAEWTAFAEAAAQVLARDRSSSEAHTRHGHWLLAAYRRGDDPKRLDEAIVGYRRAIELFPSYNGGRAQLAWALHLARAPAAAAAAEEALRLDRLNPHSEQKLRALTLFDPGPGHAAQLPAPNGNAEQMMERLRSGMGN